jgi:ABC-2 type transport system ATP-binding protein
VTILLTSHYMKDVAALCQRVVIIADGQIIYDGSLSGIIDQFSGHKVVTLTFGEEGPPGDLSRYGHLLDRDGPKVKLQVDRPDVGRVLAAILAQHTLDDVSVEDPPLEQVIADVFATVLERKKTKEPEEALAAK